MEIAFRTKSLRDLCESEEKLRSSLGPSTAEALMARLADLTAARTLLDLPEDLFSSPLGPSSNEVRIGLSDGIEAVFVANHPKLPVSAINWARVSRIKFIGTRSVDE